MKELVEVIAKALVDHPEEVSVIEKDTENALILQLDVADEDMGKVIGKQGRIAKAIRSVVKAAASKDDKKVIVIVNNGDHDMGIKYRGEIIIMYNAKSNVIYSKGAIAILV